MIQHCLWETVRSDVASKNFELANIIDEINPSNDLSFYIVEYPFGFIVDNGHFKYLNSNKTPEEIFSQNTPNSIMQDLAYANNSIPTGMVLDGAMELFFHGHDRISTKTIFYPGNLFALWRKMDKSKKSFHPSVMMSLSAGARSIFMLPNIGDHSYHRSLQKNYNIKSPPPKSLSDHWRIFSEISQLNCFDAAWRLKLLLFPKKWIEKINSNDPRFDKLKIYLYQKLWERTSYWRNQSFYDYTFSLAQAKYNLKPNPYLMDTLKHIFAIIVGALPGFENAENDIVAPIEDIQRIYKESYNLKGSFPFIMQPAYLPTSETVYYSLQFPSSLAFSPKSSKEASIATQVYELKYLYEEVIQQFFESDSGIKGTIIEDILKTINLQFFHSKPNQKAGILDPSKIPEFDHSFLQKMHDTNTLFPATSSFLRGCVKISTQGHDT